MEVHVILCLDVWKWRFKCLFEFKVYCSYVAVGAVCVD